MKREYEGRFDVQAQPLSLEGLVNVIGKAPFMDPIPKIGRLQLGAQIQVGRREKTKTLRVANVSPGISPGDWVFVGYLGK